MTTTPHLAYFISSHGYGHAARSAAIMMALVELDPQVQFELFTQVPRWFFQDSLAQPFGYHELLTDVGLAQKNSLLEDLAETLRRLANFLPFDRAQVQTLAEQVKTLQCQLIICDISPLGIAVAKAAGLPAVLVENFTWDWIYAGYLPGEARLKPYLTQLRELFAAADYHIQTEPVCQPLLADLTTGPVSRPSRTPANQIRQKLNLPDQAPVILLTMGGISWDYKTFLEHLARQRDFYFIVPGGSEQVELVGNLALLPHHSDFFHPDLVNASDAVIGKLGYSTLAEVYHAGIPFGYIPRPGFRESEMLAAYVDRRMSGLAITVPQFESGDWVSLLPDLLALPRAERHEPNGAVQAAQFITR
jgi:uncharacterized protein (TIGR00661 family)